MRNFINIVAESQRFKLAAHTVSDLPVGTIIYHGTNTNEHFEMPHGPAWFTLDDATAHKWSGWHQSDKRNQGLRRVMLFRVSETLHLLDRRNDSIDKSRGIAYQLTGDFECSPYQEAAALDGIVDGWWGREEVMIIDPVGFLEYIETPGRGIV